MTTQNKKKTFDALTFLGAEPVNKEEYTMKRKNRAESKKRAQQKSNEKKQGATPFD